MNKKISKLSDSVYKLGPLGSPKILCSYLVIDEKISIVDCGPSVVIDELLDLVAECGFSPERIDLLLLTHIHIDHAGGASNLLLNCPNATAVIPRRGFKHMIDPTILNKSARGVLGDEIMDYWENCGAINESRAISVDAGHTVNLGKQRVEYIPAPGHAPHHNVLFEKESRFLFAADALGILDDEKEIQLPTTPPPSLDFEQALRDIEKVQSLDANMLCLAHFTETKPSTAFLDSVLSRYKNWAQIIQSYLDKNKDAKPVISEFEKIFAILQERYPEYNLIPPFLKKQSTRVDVGGLFDYFLKKRVDAI